MKVSVVTISKENSAGLQKTLVSLRPLLGHSEIEVIVVDGSPAAHQNERKAFVPLGVRWLERSPDGIYKALNFGTQQAAGEYVFHLHAGDILTNPSAFRRSVELARETGSDFLYAPIRLVENGKQTFDFFPNPLFERNFFRATPFFHQSVLFKRSLFQEIGFFNPAYQIAADIDFYGRVWSAQKRTLYFPEIFSHFDVTGVSAQQTAQAFQEVNLILKQSRLPFKYRRMARLNLLLHGFRTECLTPWLRSLGILEISRRLYHSYRRRVVSAD